MMIEVGVTHQITINGDNAWIKLSVSDTLPDGTDLDSAVDQLGQKVNQKIIDVIETTVATVEKYTN